MKDCAKVVFFANTDWYLFNFRLPLARRLRSEGIEVLMVSPPGPYGRRLVAEGFRWETVPMVRRSVNPVREIGLLAALVKVFQRERPQVIHGFTVKCAVYGAIAGRIAGVPGRVGAVAGLGYVFASDARDARRLRPLVRTLLRMAFAGAGTRMILQNPDDAALFLDQRIMDGGRIRLIRGSGVDCETFHPRRRAARGEGSFQVVLAARLLREKGVQEYVDAARLLRAQGREIRFILAGSSDPGNPGAIPRETVEGWAKAGFVEWLGHVEDMAELLPSVDVMVLPSYYGEGLPRSLIEGAASGLALITTDMPGCREVVTDGVDGLLIPARDSNALARAIARLQDDPALAKRLGEAAREKALQEFDERIVFERTLSVYAEVTPALRALRRVREGTPP